MTEDELAALFDYTTFERTLWCALDRLARAEPADEHEAVSYRAQTMMISTVIELLAVGGLPVVVVNADVDVRAVVDGSAAWFGGSLRYLAPLSLILAPVVSQGEGQTFVSSLSWLLVGAFVVPNAEGQDEEHLAIMRFEQLPDELIVQYQRHHLLVSAAVYSQQGEPIVFAIPPKLAFAPLAGQEQVVASAAIARALALLHERMHTPTQFIEGPPEREVRIDQERHKTPRQPVELVFLLQKRLAVGADQRRAQ